MLKTSKSIFIRVGLWDINSCVLESSFLLTNKIFCPRFACVAIFVPQMFNYTSKSQIVVEFSGILLLLWSHYPNDHIHSGLCLFKTHQSILVVCLNIHDNMKSRGCKLVLQNECALVQDCPNISHQAKGYV